MLDEMNDTMVEPTDELLALYEAGYTNVFDECEEVKGTDGKIRPYVYNLWTKDLDHDYSVAPTHPWTQMFDGDDLTPIYDRFSAEGHVIRVGLATEFVNWNPEVRQAVTDYMRALAKEIGRTKVYEILHANIRQLRRYWGTECLTKVYTVRLLGYVLQPLLMYTPELIVSECEAGQELLEVQRYLFKYFRETFN